MNPADNTSEISPLLSSKRRSTHAKQGMFFRHNLEDWLPSRCEMDGRERPLRRRIFLFITEPESSVLSLVFYFVLITGIFASNVLMIMQTMEAYQFTPDDCRSCGGDITYYFEDDDGLVDIEPGIPCMCPPEPLSFTIDALDFLMNFFAVEWCLRVATFVPEYPESTWLRSLVNWTNYLSSTPIVLDALAIFPYYLENLPKGLVSLRLLRIFRIFQLVRLGQYNYMFLTLTNVLAKAVKYLRLLIIILGFGGALCGSCIYWIERGTWKYHAESGTYCFVRTSADGMGEEPSPFRSIPEAFWWFMVTATTVGYGDIYPTSSGGKWVATLAMLMGTLTIAFPVSVFSDLWSSELKQVQGFEELNQEDSNPGETSEAPSRLQSMSDGSQYGSQSYSTSTLAMKDTVTLERDDLKHLVDCLDNIEESKRKIQSILHKYNIHANEDLERNPI